MSTQIGYIDSDGHPRLSIRICGPDPNNFIEEEALVDTGFTGLLMLPAAKAFGLGIVPTSTGAYTLADDSTVINYLGNATVTVRPPLIATQPITHIPESVSGVVVLCGNGALVGMEFLRLLDKYLLVGPVVILLDVAVVNAATANANPSPPA